MNSTILKHGKDFYDRGHYKKALFFYELFEKFYPELQACTSLSKNLCHKKSLSEHKDNNIIIAIPVFDNKKYIFKCALNIAKQVYCDVKFDLINGACEDSYLLATIDLSYFTSYDCEEVTDTKLYNFFEKTKLFDATFYKKQYNFVGTYKEALIDYIKNGHHTGKLPARWFDIYKKNEGELEKIKQNIGRKRDKLQSNPKISVIIPVYNNTPYLQQCIDSVINQSFKNIEIIIINDGSTDKEAVSILKKYAEIDNRIHLIHKKNTGYGHSMNCGLYAAKGEFISIVESDDYISTNMYEILYNKAKEFDCDCVKGDSINFYGHGSNRKENYIYSRKNHDEYDTIIDPQTTKSAFDFSITCCGIYKKSIIDSYEILYSETPRASYQDITFNFLILCCIKRLMFVKHPVYYYRQDNEVSSISNTGLVYMGYKQYQFIKNKILTIGNKDYFLPMLYYRMFNNFIYTQNRIAKEHRHNFNMFFSKYFKYCLKKNYLNLSHFSQQDILKLYFIVYNVHPQFSNMYNICFCTNDDYSKPMYCAIKSIIKNSDKNNLYIINILFFNINKHNKKEIAMLSTKNTLINFIDCNQYDLAKYTYQKKHYSKEMFLRFLIPEIFSEHKTVLYLDCDMIIQHDISKIFLTETDKQIAVVKNLCNKNIKEYVENIINIDSDKYFNSGVILFNINKIKPKNISKKIFDIFPNPQKLEMPDQDMLNIYFKDKVHYLDLKWNFQWHNYIANKYHDFTPAQKDEYLAAAEHPYIIHYTTNIKPWINKSLPFSKNYLIYEQDCNIYIHPNYKISVIIPIYNAASTLKKALDSVVKQSLLCEIICIDDGSTDNTPYILEEYIKKYKNIFVYSQKNLGAGSARNKGLSMASGEYIFFLDADDYCPNQNCLETLYSSAKKSNSVICGGSLCFDIDGEFTIKKDTHFVFNEEKIEYYNNVQYDYCYQRYIYSREFLDKNNIRFKDLLRFQDPVFLVRAMYAANKFYQIPHFVYCYKAGNNVSWTSQKVYDLLQGLKMNLVFAHENNLYKLFETTKNRFLYEYSKIYNNFLYDKKIYTTILQIKLLQEIYSKIQ